MHVHVYAQHIINKLAGPQSETGHWDLRTTYVRFTGETCGVCLHSAKGGAVETGCSDFNGVIYYFTISYYPNPLHPPPTAPPCNEYPVCAIMYADALLYVCSSEDMYSIRGLRSCMQVHT